MTAGTVVITGGIIAAVILLTIVTVLCCCRLQYYCCKSEGSEEGEVEEEEEEEDETFTKSSPIPASQSFPPCSPEPPSPRPLSLPSPPSFPSPPRQLCILPPQDYSSKQLLTCAELYEPCESAAYSRFSPALPCTPIRSNTFCPSCSGLLPYYLPREEEGLRNGGGRISYRSLQQPEVNLPMDMPSFNKLSLLHAMREVMTQHSFSTDV